MPEPTAELMTLRASTADLVHWLESAGWSDADVRVDSRCEGWTRAHVLTHLARNADAIATTLGGALRGQIVPRYPDGWAARNAAIEQGSSRPTAVLVADVRDSAQRLDRVLGAVLDDDAWDRMTDQNLLAHQWVSRRLCEVEVHRVDLAAGHGPRDWPPQLVADLLPPLINGMAQRTEVPLRVVATTNGSVSELAGSTWDVPGAGEIVEVAGPDWALLAWGTGRGSLLADELTATPALSHWR